MANIPIFQTGQFLSAITLTPQTVSSAGVLGDTTPVQNFIAIIDGNDIGLDKIQEEISPISANIENAVPIIDSISMRLTLLKADAVSGVHDTSTNMFQQFINSIKNNVGDYFKLVYTNGTAGGSQELVTVFGILEELTEGIHGKGRQTITMTMRSIAADVPITRAVS